MDSIAAALVPLPSSSLPHPSRRTIHAPIPFFRTRLHLCSCCCSDGLLLRKGCLPSPAAFSLSFKDSSPSLTARAFVDSSSHGQRPAFKMIVLDVSKAMSSVKHMAVKVFTSVAPQDSLMIGSLPVNFVATLGITVAVLVMAVLTFWAKPAERAGGSVADLVKRGQLRSDRRADSRPLKYEDPFNNPMVKVGGRNSVVKMYGKMFRLQPVTLTEEKMVSHQNRRVQAYQWKRPTVFLIEGEPVPEGADPDAVRWIPSNHPFATAKNDIDEVSAERNMYQTRGVPSRVRAEHEALRKRMMETAQREMDLLPVMYPGEQENGIEKSFASTPEQPIHENGHGSRSIKPFDKPDGEGTARLENPANVHAQSAESGLPFSGGRFVDGQVAG